MKRLIVMVAVCIGFWLMPAGNLEAQSDYPDYDDVYVNDFAGILDSRQEAQIRRQFSSLKEDVGVEATVVTLESYLAYGTDDESIDMFATSLFNTWGIGNSETNTGILLLIDLEARTVIFRTGIGWESRIEAETDRIIEEVLLPELRDGNMGEAMVAGANEIAQVVFNELKPVPTVTPTRKILSTKVVSTRVIRTVKEDYPSNSSGQSGRSSSSNGSSGGFFGFIVLLVGVIWGFYTLINPGGRKSTRSSSGRSNRSWISSVDSDDDYYDDYNDYGSSGSGGGGFFGGDDSSFGGGHSSDDGSSGEW